MALHDVGLGFGRPPMINHQVLGPQVKSGPNIFPGQAARHFPLLFTQTDSAVGRDSANEMHPSSGQGQVHWQAGAPPGCEFSARDAGAGVFDRHAVQRGWGIGVVPRQKLRTLALKRFERSEVILAPEAARPELVEPFHERIAFGFAGRNEDQFDAQVESQAYEPPPGAGRFAQAGEGGVVIDLQEVRHAQRGADLQEMGADRGGALIAAAALLQGMGLQIHSVKHEHLLSPLQVAGGPVTRTPGQRGIQGRRGIESRRGRGLRFRGQVSGLEPAIDRGEGGERTQQATSAQFVANGPGPAQAIPVKV